MKHKTNYEIKETENKIEYNLEFLHVIVFFHNAVRTVYPEETNNNSKWANK